MGQLGVADLPEIRMDWSVVDFVTPPQMDIGEGCQGLHPESAVFPYKTSQNQRCILGLFMLVSALVGLDSMQAAYAHAIAQGYRFYSYGDSSLLLP